MTEDVKPEVIKKTQELLGKYFKKPPLTEKLLKKPPFRFLHDVVSAIIRETKFLDGLYSEEEMNSDNITDKKTKLAYLTKLIDVVKLITGANLTVRASKIISGQEPTKTNELLQAIGKCLDKKVSSTEAIEHYLQNITKKKKTTKAKEDTNKNLGAKISSNSKRNEIEKGSVEKKRSSTGKVISSNEKSDEPHHAMLTDNREKNEQIKNKEEVSATALHEKIPSSSNKKKNSSSKASANGSNSVNIVKDKKSEESIRRKDSANKRKQSAHIQHGNDSNNMKELTDIDQQQINHSFETKNDEQNIQMSIEDQQNDQSTVNIEPIQLLNDSAKGINFSNQQENITRPRTSLRPPSTRPLSSRPAAPRMKVKTEITANEEILTPMGSINVIVENSDNKNDDDAEDMVVVETHGNDRNSIENTNYKIDNELSQEHGHLVAQIVETQRELVNNDDVDVLPKKVDIFWETGSKRDHETMVKEIDKLRGTIQTLTRATNPLGKLFDYVQEDIEIMQKELLDWRNQYIELNKQLEKEQKQTQELIEPMKESLKEIDNNMNDQLNKICQIKARILKNDQKIQRLLNGNS